MQAALVPKSARSAHHGSGLLRVGATEFKISEGEPTCGCQSDTHLTCGLPYERIGLGSGAYAQVRVGKSMSGPVSATMHRSSRRCSSVGRAAVL